MNHLEYQKQQGPHPAIVLPMPPKELYPNSSKHWRAKAGVRAPYRGVCKLIAKTYCRETFCKLPRWEEAVLRLEMFYGRDNVKAKGRRKPMDPDNAL